MTFWPDFSRFGMTGLDGKGFTDTPRNPGWFQVTGYQHLQAI